MVMITLLYTTKEETSAMSHFYSRLDGAQWTGRLSMRLGAQFQS